MLRYFVHQSPTTDYYSLSLHDALPISDIQVGVKKLRFCSVQLTGSGVKRKGWKLVLKRHWRAPTPLPVSCTRSEEHTSELQSHSDIVCRLLLEKKKYMY